MNMRRLLFAAGLLVACSDDPGEGGGSEQPVGTTGGAPSGGAGGAGAFGTGGLVGSGGVVMGSGGTVMPGAGGALPGSGGVMMGSGGTIPVSGGAGPGGNSGMGGSFGGGGMASETGGAGGGVSPGTGGMDPGTGGMDPGTGGMDPGSGGAAPVGDRPAGCEQLPALPAVTDYGARGPYQVERQNNTGPSGQYTLFRPADLSAGGQFPPVSWGNGVTTTPEFYIPLLETVASHGFVVIASNSATMTAQLVRQGLEWLIAENGSTFGGNLAVQCGATIGYSMGGGSAVGAGSHPAVKAIVSLHGLTAQAGQASGPLLLITSDNDGFVTKSGFVAPTYAQSSTQPTIMATLRTGLPPDFAGHLIPLGDAGDERAPLVAWLRMWLYGDDGARPWFYGPSCTLCTAPWTDIQRKNHTW